MNLETLTDINVETEDQMDKLKEVVDGLVIKNDLQLSKYQYSFFGEPITIGIVTDLLTKVASAMFLFI